jgi:hypothetical protein
MDLDLPICPDCSGKLKHGLAIARFIDRLDIRLLVCGACHHVHWFRIEDGALTHCKERQGLWPSLGLRTNLVIDAPHLHE